MTPGAAGQRHAARQPQAPAGRRRRREHPPAERGHGLRPQADVVLRPGGGPASGRLRDGEGDVGARGGDARRRLHGSGRAQRGEDPAQAGRTEPRTRIEIDLTDPKAREVHLAEGDTLLVPRGNTFFVSGEVRKPGAYQLEKSTTAFGAVTVAGGFTEKAGQSQAKLIRRSPIGAGADGGPGPLGRRSGRRGTSRCGTGTRSWSPRGTPSTSWARCGSLAPTSSIRRRPRSAR